MPARKQQDRRLAKRMQQYQQASEEARQAGVNKEPAKVVAERALMQRQGKRLHQQDGK
jgi:hypothetical protein